GVKVQGLVYLNDLEPVAETDGQGNRIATFIYADRANTPSYLLKGGRVYRLIADHLGSVRLVVDIQDGSIAQRLDYDAWGQVLTDTNPGFQPFGFAGGIYDPDTGLVRFGARDYDPEVGRWTTKEPILFWGAQNFYVYALNNSQNYIDISGLEVDLNLNRPGSLDAQVGERYPNNADEISVSAHGDRTGVWDKRVKESQPLHVAEMVAEIQKLEKYTPEIPIRLLSCHAGQGQDSLAAKLAKALPNDVIATEGRISGNTETGAFSPFIDSNNNHKKDSDEAPAIFTAFPGNKKQ
ncbi:MAG: RHS repeat domain-containing protein, partial [Porticoccaceae bacterium]